MLSRGGCEGRGRDESIRSQQASGVGVGGGRAGETRRGGRWPVGGIDKVPIKTSRAIPTHGGACRAEFCESQPESERSRRSASTWSRWSTLKNPYLHRESKWSKGNVGGAEVDVSDKSQAAIEGNPGGVGDAGGVTRETGLSGGASFLLGMARWASPAHCSASCTDCAKVSTGKKEAKEMHPLEASRALKRISGPHPDGRWSKGAWGEDGC